MDVIYLDLYHEAQSGLPFHFTFIDCYLVVICLDLCHESQSACLPFHIPFIDCYLVVIALDFRVSCATM